VGKKRSSEKVPTITMKGTANIHHQPDRVAVSVSIETANENRDRAWTEFSARARQLTDIASQHGTLTELIPSEDTRVIEKAFRQVDETIVSTTSTIEFPFESFGSLAKSLIEAKFVFSSPEYKFPATSGPGADLLGRAAADALVRAEAIAANVKSRLGRVVAVDTGDAPVTRLRRTSILDLDESLSVDAMTLRHSRMATPMIDSDTFRMLSLEDVPRQTTTASVTVTFELLPVEDSDELIRNDETPGGVTAPR